MDAGGPRRDAASTENCRTPSLPSWICRTQAPRATTRTDDEDEGNEMVNIDCDGCAVRGLACGDCVVTVLLGAPPEGVLLDETERRAIAVLAAGGLVPPLRLVTDDGDGEGRCTHVA